MMTTIPDPLSSEERALAAMLARVAPHGVPSPEIDASILSASHDAVAGTAARSRRPRWQVPMGVAASMVLAVGVAWQLRPTPPEAAGFDAASVEARSSVEAPAAAPTPAQEVASAGPAVDAVADSTAAPPPRKSLAPPVARSPVVDARKAAPAATPPAPARARPAPSAPAAPAYAPSPPPPSAVAERSSNPSAGIQRIESARPAGTVAAAEADSRTETATAPTRRELRVSPGSERVQENAPRPPIANGATRARRTDLQVPVAADAQLQPGDWLERVRTRYGLGDADVARRSLLLFVQDHPTEAVPDDLEPLLDE